MDDADRRMAAHLRSLRTQSPQEVARKGREHDRDHYTAQERLSALTGH